MHKFITFCILLFLAANCAATIGFGDGVFGKIKSGFEMAGKMLGLDRASGVAQLVSDAFGKTAKKGEAYDYDNKGTIFSGFLRILGLDTKRIGAIAVNAIIFMAQLISRSLSKPPPAYLNQGKNLEDSPIEWLLQNPNVERLLSHARSDNLPEDIIEYLKQQPNPEDTGCLQLLICKSAPFVWSMQKAINTRDGEVVRGKKALTHYMPSVDEVADNGDECELKYPHCVIPI